MEPSKLDRISADRDGEEGFFASSASAMVLCFDSRVEEEVHWGQGKSDTQEPFSFPV